LSGYSSFDIIDHTRSSTPFGSTSDTSPVKATSALPISTNPSSEVETSDDIMPNEHVSPFHGDNEDENPEDFLQISNLSSGIWERPAMK
jgi:hypothetical protein